MFTHTILSGRCLPQLYTFLAQGCIHNDRLVHCFFGHANFSGLAWLEGGGNETEKGAEQLMEEQVVSLKTDRNVTEKREKMMWSRGWVGGTNFHTYWKSHAWAWLFLWCRTRDTKLCEKRKEFKALTCAIENRSSQFSSVLVGPLKLDDLFSWPFDLYWIVVYQWRTNALFRGSTQMRAGVRGPPRKFFSFKVAQPFKI